MSILVVFNSFIKNLFTDKSKECMLALVSSVQYTVSKNVQTYFLSELCQISTDCEIFLAKR